MFDFPDSRQELSLWDLACRITGQNALDAQPTNETRDQIRTLVRAVHSNQLPVVFGPGGGAVFAVSAMPSASCDSLATDWRKLHLVMVRQDDWINYSRPASPGISDGINRAGILDPLRNIEANDATPKTEHEMAWLNETMQANYWFRLASVTPEQAALLLCRHNPNEPGLSFDDALAVRNNETGERELRSLKVFFDALERSSPQIRTLREWLDVALDNNLAHHSWVSRYVQLSKLASTPTKAQEDAPSSKTEFLATRTELINAFGAFSLTFRKSREANRTNYRLSSVRGQG